MPKSGPIVLIEDDTDDQEIMTEILNAIEITNPLAIFKNGQEALDYLKTTTDKPFLILCDINMPIMDGLQLRMAIEKDPALRRKSIPFVFLSTTNNPNIVRQAYMLTVQGFFQKRNNLDDQGKNLKMIIDYWNTCLHPEK